MQNKNIIVSTAVAAVLILGAGCFSNTTVQVNNTNASLLTNVSVSTNSTTTGSFDTSSTSASTVTYTSAGVSPSSLTVSSGTTVVFVNNDAVSHQLASNPHPTHTGLPGFQGTINPGGTFSFTFTKTGTFGYHDHLDPFSAKWQGTVVVQ